MHANFAGDNEAAFLPLVGQPITAAGARLYLLPQKLEFFVKCGGGEILDYSPGAFSVRLFLLSLGMYTTSLGDSSAVTSFSEMPAR
jgi:hypothetical protein